MGKRLLACTAKDFEKMNKEELLQAIKASEGRTIMAEIIAETEPYPYGCTNGEIAKAFGADMMLLNKVDLNNIKIGYLPETDEMNKIKLFKKLCGRPTGLNLEPIDLNVEMAESRINIPDGRQATEKNFKKCNELGFDFILLTGNPGVGVSNQKIADAVKVAKENYNGIIIAGKMHGAGSNEEVLDLKAIESFIENGADIILVPAAGTVPGITVDKLYEVTQFVKSKGKLVLSAIGTSQESSDVETIKKMGLWNKMAGVDIHHIGDAGYAGLPPYENIYNLSIATRGLRHTVRMMAASNDRDSLAI